MFDYIFQNFCNIFPHQTCRNYLFVAGGIDKNNNYLNSVEIIDFLNNKNRIIENMTIERSSYNNDNNPSENNIFSLVVIDNNLYAIGGNKGYISIEKFYFIEDYKNGNKGL